MEISVIIPTHARASKLRTCVEAMAHQTLDRDQFEVLVGVDGLEGVESARAACGEHALVRGFRKCGQADVRNQLLPHARGRIVVFLNDDVAPARACLAEHLLAHKNAAAPSVVIGDAPFRVHEDDKVFDVLVRATSMVFFYDQMPGSASWREANPAITAPVIDARRNWGFRHAWSLNLSIPIELVRAVGGFHVFPDTYGFEDDDLAFRIQERFGSPVHFAPAAIAEHDHRLTPCEYLEREERLGHAAWGFAGQSARCARAMFGRDIRSPEELRYAEMCLEREAGPVERSRADFAATKDLSAGIMNAGSPGDRARLIRLLYQQHLPLKRWHFRRGLVRAARGE